VVSQGLAISFSDSSKPLIVNQPATNKAPPIFVLTSKASKNLKTV